MSSCTMGVQCWRCGELAYSTINFSFGYHAVVCDECGHDEYSEQMGNNETIEEARIDGWEVYPGEEGYWKIKISLGYGTIWFAKKSGGGFGVALAKPISLQSIERILKRFESPLFDRSRCRFTVWDMKSHRLRYIHSPQGL